MEQDPSKHDGELQAFFESQDVDSLHGLATAFSEGAEVNVGQTVSLALVYYTLFQKGESVDYLDQAILYGQQALAETPRTHPDFVFRLEIVTQMMCTQAQIKGSREDLDEALFMLQQIQDGVMLQDMASQQSSRSTYNLHAWLPRYLDDETVRLVRRARQTENQDDLQKAMCQVREAVFTATDPKGKSILMQILAECLMVSFTGTHDLNDIAEAITTAKHAMDMTSPGDEHQVTALDTLAGCYHYRFQETRFEESYSLEDLNENIRLTKELIATLASSQHDKIHFLDKLGGSLQRHFRHTGDIESLQEAIDIAEEVVSATSHDHPDVGHRLMALSIRLHYRFEVGGEEKDLLNAIKRLKEALSATSRDDVDYCRILGLLAGYLRDLSNRTGNLEDIQQAIDMAHEAVSGPPGGRPDLGSRLHLLAILLMERSNLTGSIEDLQEAINQAKKAADTLTTDQESLADIQSTLVGFFLHSFQRTSSQEDLDYAIDWARTSVSSTSSHHPDLAGRLGRLASGLRLRFRNTCNTEDWEEAVSLLEKAVSLPKSTDGYFALHSLATCYHERFRYGETRAIEDLDTFIQKTEEILTTIPKLHYLSVSIRNGLATGLYDRSELVEGAGAASDNERAVKLWKTTVNSESAPPQDRIEVAFKAAIGLQKMRSQEAWNEICEITETAVRLLPQLSSRALGQGDQQYMLGNASGLATLATSAALNGGRSKEHALELLDHGRGIIAELQLGFRTDLTSLRERQPALANKFEHLRDVLNTPVSTSNSTVLGNDSTRMLNSNERHKANVEFNKLIDTIRKEIDFDRFLLLPPLANELREAASSGPVVVINVTDVRCDAFLVKPSSIEVFHLKDVRHEHIEQNVELITSIRQHSTRGYPQSTSMYDMLRWLWDTIVGPILNQLGFTQNIPQGDEWPHVWWIPTGPLSMLPLHAAGHYEPESGAPVQTALDKVVSSYSSSLKALLRARAARSEHNPDFAANKALLVSMASTPGCSDLAFADTETEMLNGLFEDVIPTLLLKQPPKDEIMNILKTHTVWHFAGHGVSDGKDPSQSRLILSDGEKNPLTVQDLSSLNLRSAGPWLAYLSACSTGDNPTESLYDESIHLMTACQIAGFRHVVGSLWEASDKYSSDVAQAFYRSVIAGGTLTDNGIANALHKATLHLRGGGDPSEINRKVKILGMPTLNSGSSEREAIRNDPFVWAGYVHVGP